MIASTETWTAPPATLEASTQRVDVWVASLDRAAYAGLPRLLSVLSRDERDRAERFQFAQHRCRFIAGRGLLRLILARYAAIPAKDLGFCYGPQGKPSLRAEMGVRDLMFNVAHSEGLALYAVARERRIGVDVEHMREVPDVESIIRRHFSVGEQAAWRSLPVSEHGEAFLRAWTRKEAYLKACGDGLTRPLYDVEVTFTPRQPVRLLSVEGNERKARSWSLRALAPAPGCVAALCVEGHGWAIACWQHESSYFLQRRPPHADQVANERDHLV